MGWKTRILWLRRSVQGVTLLMLVGIPWEGLWFQGTLLSFDCLGVPFAEPLSVVQILLSGALPGWRRVLGALLVVLITLGLGRIFCSWFCPFGLLSEGVQRLCGALHRGRVPRKAGAVWLFESGIRSRSGIVGAGLVLVALLGGAFLNLLFVPNALVGALRETVALWSGEGFRGWVPFVPLVVVLGVLLAEGRYGKRLWCRWLCPQSVLLSVLTRVPVGVRLVRDPAHCLCPDDKRACRAACSLGLDPRAGLSPLECTQCGACVLACAGVHGGKKAALSLSPCSLPRFCSRSTQESP